MFLFKITLLKIFSFFLFIAAVNSQEETFGNDIATYQNFLNSDKNNSASRKKDNPKLICFYVFSHDFKAEVMKNLCTHINVGFFAINKSNYSVDIKMDEVELLTDVMLLKKNDENLKVLMSVGGSGDDDFSLMVKNHTTRKMFIRSVMSVIKKFKLDGLDIDWEYPVVNGDSKEKVKFVQLLQEIRVEFNRHQKKFILSVDVPSIQPIIELGFYVQHIAEYVDYVNVMCYDYHFYTKIRPFTGHNSPLYSSSEGIFRNYNVNFSINYWISNQMPREKVVLGLPTYGHSFRLSLSNRHSIDSPASGYGSVGESGFASYTEICSFIKKATVIYDKVSEVPYAYAFPDWISFDDEISLTIKASYALEKKLGGVMVFSVNADDYSGICNPNGVTLPLIKKIRSIMFNEI